MKKTTTKRGGMSTYSGGASGMSDKEYLNDGLISQKQITAAYNTFAGECKNIQMRDAFLSILKEEHEIQSGFFNSLEQNGWYQTEQAPAAKVNKAYKQFVGGTASGSTTSKSATSRGKSAATSRSKSTKSATTSTSSRGKTSTASRNASTKNGVKARGSAEGRAKGGKAAVRATGRSTTGKFVSKKNDGFNGSPGRYS